MTGAAQLDAGLLCGRQLINLDSEEDGIVYVGCAGGGDTQLTVELGTELPQADGLALSIALTGLKGGHSGCDIHLQRGNAVKLLGRALWAAYLGGGFRLARFDGGSAHNAIPREAFATVVVAGEGRNALMAAGRTGNRDDLCRVRAGRPGYAVGGGCHGRARGGLGPGGRLSGCSGWSTPCRTASRR